jgi:hypothetical protein
MIRAGISYRKQDINIHINQRRKRIRQFIETGFVVI